MVKKSFLHSQNEQEEQCNSLNTVEFGGFHFNGASFSHTRYMNATHFNPGYNIFDYPNMFKPLSPLRIESTEYVKRKLHHPRLLIHRHGEINLKTGDSNNTLPLPLWIMQVAHKHCRHTGTHTQAFAGTLKMTQHTFQ